MTQKTEYEACGMHEAAIVCSHIAEGDFPILQAVRTERTGAADSGWQFLCNSGHHEDLNEAKVWSVAEVLAKEPTLGEWLEAPFETVLWRRSAKDLWQVYKEQ